MPAFEAAKPSELTLLGVTQMKNETLVEIGARLRSARKAKHYTQERVSELAGVSVKMISAAENGQKAMRPENIVKLCSCLSISTDYLLCGESPALQAIAGEREGFQRLSPRQKEALSKIIDDFLSAFEENP